MIRDSFLLGGCLAFFARLYQWYLGTKLCRMWQRLALVCANALNGSLIVRFFRADWDAALHIERLSMPFLRPLCRIQHNVSGKSKVARLLQESLLLSLLDVRAVFLLLCLTAFLIPFAPTLILLLGVLGSFGLYLLNVLLGRMTASGLGLVGIFAVLFALCFAVSAVCGEAFPSSLEEFFMFVGLMLAMPVAASVLRDEKRRDSFLFMLLFSGTLVALYGIYQYITGVQINAAWVDSESFSTLKTRAYATFGNPNVMGEYMIVICCVGVALFWKTKNGFLRFFAFCMTGLAGLGLLATGSRGAILGLVCAAAVFALLAEHRLLPFGVLAVLAFPFVAPKEFIHRFTAALEMTDSSTKYRMSIYAACFDMVRDYWLTGIGVGAFSLVYPRYLYSASNSYHSHNLFLQILLELGIVGLLVFLCFLLLWAQRLYASLAKDRTGNRFLTGALLGAMGGLLVQGMTDYLWFNYRIVLLFWLLGGMGLAAAGRKGTAS